MEHLRATERERLRRSIVERRNRAIARADALAADFDDIVTASADAVRDDEHDPEGSTIAFERSQVAALLADARAQAEELRLAAQRVDQPGAGRCERCGTPVPFERLLARPTTRRCVACAA